MSLPNGYSKKKQGATWKIYDDDGNQVSCGYHEINYPRVKVGAHETILVIHDGYFIPEEISAATRSEIYEPTRFKSHIPDGLEDAIRDYHGDRSSSPSRRRKSKTPSPTRNRESKDRRKTENSNKTDDSSDTKSDSEENNQKELPYENISISKDEFMVIVAANIAGILEDGHTNMDYHKDYKYIIEAYPQLKQILQRVNSAQELRDMKDELPFTITDDDFNQIEAAENMARERRYQEDSDEEAV